MRSIPLEWMNWRSVSGVLCGSKIELLSVPSHFMGGWPARNEVERRSSIREMKMLRWMAGITRFDRIYNQDIQQQFGVVAVADELREARSDSSPGPTC